MKKEVTVTIAALGFISSAVGIHAYATSDNYVQGTAGECPLVINLSSEFDREVIENEKIQSLTFSIDCKTNLDETRAYLTQGQVYYYTDSTLNHRNFADLVAVNDDDYEWIAHQDSVCTEFIVGSEERPLYADLDKDITISWTWITPEKLSMYELYVTTTDGLTYPISVGEDFYTVEISEEMEEDRITEYQPDGKKCYPFGNDVDFSITSTFGEGREWCDHLAWDMIPLSGNGIIYAVESGTIDFAGWENEYDWSQGFGQYVRIENNASDKWFYYGHMSDIFVSEGQYVEAGTPLGKYGTTGYSTGEHLHLEIRDSGEYGNKLSPADYFGLPDEYGIVHITPDRTDLAIKCLSLNKHFEVGSLGANGINPSDKNGSGVGALSLGILQMRGSNAKRLLNYLYENDTDTYITIANRYSSKFVDILNKDDSWWDRHDIITGDKEYQFYEELLDNDNMIQLQYNWCIEHEKKVIDDVVSHSGISDEKYVLLFARCSNYAPYGDASETIRSGVTYEEACDAARNDKYILKADDLIDLINNNKFDIVTVDTLKGER